MEETSISDSNEPIHADAPGTLNGNSYQRNMLRGNTMWVSEYRSNIRPLNSLSATVWLWAWTPTARADGTPGEGLDELNIQVEVRMPDLGARYRYSRILPKKEDWILGGIDMSHRSVHRMIAWRCLTILLALESVSRTDTSADHTTKQELLALHELRTRCEMKGCSMPTDTWASVLESIRQEQENGMAAIRRKIEMWNKREATLGCIADGAFGACFVEHLEKLWPESAVRAGDGR